MSTAPGRRAIPSVSARPYRLKENSLRYGRTGTEVPPSFDRIQVSETDRIRTETDGDGRGGLAVLAQCALRDPLAAAEALPHG